MSRINILSLNAVRKLDKSQMHTTDGGFLGDAFRADDEKFLPAHTAHHLVAAGIALERLRRQSKHGISGGMPVPVSVTEMVP